MKRIVVVLAGVSFLVSFNTTANAAWWNKPKKETQATEPANIKEQKKKEEAPKPVEVKNVDKQKQADQARKKQLLSAKLEALNNTEWRVEIWPAGSKEKKQVFTLKFSNHKFASDFPAQDFPQTNFTPTYNDDGSLIWETMQTSEKQGVAFWRGEFSADSTSMRGLISHQLPNKTNKDYSFESIGKEGVTENQ